MRPVTEFMVNLGAGLQSGEGRGWGTQRRGGASSQIRERARFMVAVFVSAL